MAKSSHNPFGMDELLKRKYEPSSKEIPSTLTLHSEISSGRGYQEPPKKRYCDYGPIYRPKSAQVHSSPERPLALTVNVSTTSPSSSVSPTTGSQNLTAKKYYDFFQQTVGGTLQPSTRRVHAPPSPPPTPATAANSFVDSTSQHSPAEQPEQSFYHASAFQHLFPHQGRLNLAAAMPPPPGAYGSLTAMSPYWTNLFYLQNQQRLSNAYYELQNGRPYHPSMHYTNNKKKGGQVRFTNRQTSRLELTFREKNYLNASDRRRLAASLKLTDKQVKTWFQNRRAKSRKANGDHSKAESHVSPSSMQGHPDDAYSPDDTGRCPSTSSVDNDSSS